MKQVKKRKLVDRLKDVLDSFINYMKLDVDDDEYYEGVESTKGERILAKIAIVIVIVVSFMTLLAGIGIVILFAIFGFC